MIQGQLLQNQTLNLTEDIVQSNVFNCTINAQGHTFDRCNVEDCIFTSPAKFVKSNVTACEGVENSIFDHSNNISKEERDAREKEMQEMFGEDYIPRH